MSGAQRVLSIGILAGNIMVYAALASSAQSTAGAVSGTVLDPSGAVVADASVVIRNSITGYQQTATTDGRGTFFLRNISPNPYRLEVTAPGFQVFRQDLSVRASVPIELKIVLEIEGSNVAITVQGGESQNLENVPYAHNDLFKEALTKLPILSASSGLNDAITLSTPGVVADSNGFFHPLGDHAQVTFSIDGQPISDQQSKLFSTQVPLNAIQSMELVTGMPSAEFGGKTSLVVSAVTQSGLGKRPFGSMAMQYGSFGFLGEEASLGWGNAKLGNFLVANSNRSGRFLDTPEFQPIHAIGNNATLFDHLDFQPGSKDVFHLNLMGARNWFQTPNTYDQLAQDQRQKVVTFNVAPGYEHTFNPTTLLTVTSFVRQDQVNYYPSRDPFADSPATLAQARRLTNYGVKADVSYVRGMHNLKAGTQLMQTRLREGFNLGITDPYFNPICVDGAGNPQALPDITKPSQCAGLGFQANPDLHPGLIPYDLTRKGTLFNFNGSAGISEYAFYIQDSITIRNLTLSPGLRIDRYVGLSRATGVEPRLGASYLIKRTGTVLRASYARTLETPYNENLVISSATGSGGLATNVFGGYGSQPLEPGRRSQYNAGVQQSLSRFLMFDGEYFWKNTDNAFDFDTLFNTPIHFPISWRRSKIDGFSARVSTIDIHGFQAFTTLGHTRARFFGPEVGGLIFNSPLDTGVFRIDHDQAFQQTTSLHYQRPKNAEWIAFTWRYDGGEVAGAVTSLADALSLTGAQQAAIGFFCGNQVATQPNPITSCSGSNFGATGLRIPATGTFNPDLNPPRIAPRHLLDVAIGTDNLLHGDRKRTALKFSILNLTNQVALYNFLSTFSGTHFVAPRTYQFEIQFTF
jgi:hypothetical protein